MSDNAQLQMEENAISYIKAILGYYANPRQCENCSHFETSVVHSCTRNPDIAFSVQPTASCTKWRLR